MSQQKPLTRETALMLANSPGTSRTPRSLGIHPELSFRRTAVSGLFGIPRTVRFHTADAKNYDAEQLCGTVRANPAGRDLALQQLCGFRDFDSLAKLARENGIDYSESVKYYLALALSERLNEEADKPGFEPKQPLQCLKLVASAENKENALFAVSWLARLKAVSELVAVSIGKNPAQAGSYHKLASLEAAKALHALAFDEGLGTKEKLSVLGAFPILFDKTIHPGVRDFLRQKFPQKFK